MFYKYNYCSTVNNYEASMRYSSAIFCNFPWPIHLLKTKKYTTWGKSSCIDLILYCKIQLATVKKGPCVNTYLEVIKGL